MGTAFHKLLILAACLPAVAVYSQSRVSISGPHLEIKENMVHIYYDILEGDTAEKYVVSLDVTDVKGNPLAAGALTGDIGMVEGGPGKHIDWDLVADSIYMEAYVYVKIHARVIPPPEPVIPAAIESIPPAGDPVARDETDPGPGGKTSAVEPETSAAENSKSAMAGTSASFSRTGLVIQSLAVPGLGLARVTGKPHWLRAVAGYGCIAGSVVLNQRGISLFESVDDIAIPDRAETVFKRSVRCDNLSEALAITALGIWIADAVWTWAGTKDFGNVTAGRSGPGLVLGTGFESISNIPVISFRFNLRK